MTALRTIRADNTGGSCDRPISSIEKNGEVTMKKVYAACFLVSVAACASPVDPALAPEGSRGAAAAGKPQMSLVIDQVSGDCDGLTFRLSGANLPRTATHAGVTITLNNGVRSHDMVELRNRDRKRLDLVEHFAKEELTEPGKGFRGIVEGTVWDNWGVVLHAKQDLGFVCDS